MTLFVLLDVAECRLRYIEPIYRNPRTVRTGANARAGAGDPRAAAGAAPPRLRAEEGAARDARLLLGGLVRLALSRPPPARAEWRDRGPRRRPGRRRALDAGHRLPEGRGRGVAAPARAPAHERAHPQGLPDHPRGPGAVPGAPRK